MHKKMLCTILTHYVLLQATLPCAHIPAALHPTERPARLVNKQLSWKHTKEIQLQKKIHTNRKYRLPLLLNGCRARRHTPTKTEFWIHRQNPKQPFTYDIAQHPLNLCNAAGPGNLSQLAGRLPDSESPRRNRKAECPLTTNKLPKKTRNVSALSLSLFLFSQSSGDSPQAESSRRHSSAYQRPLSRAYRCTAQHTVTKVRCTASRMEDPCLSVGSHPAAAFTVVFDHTT